MGASANSLMEELKFPTKSLKMPNINQNIASSSMKNDTAHMETVVCSDMNRENLMNFTSITMYTL
jgi:hypothetical protein